MSVTFSVAEFFKAALPTIGFVAPITMAIVKWLGRFPFVNGNIELLASMLTGLVLGGVVMYAELLPTTFPDYLIVVLTGLLTGLVASGVYDVGKDIVEKSVAKSMNAPDDSESKVS